MRYPGGSAPRGMTLLEVMISMGVLAVMLLISMYTMRTLSEGMRSEMTVSDKQKEGKAALDRMMRDLRRMKEDADPANFQITMDGVPAGGATITGNGISYRLPGRNASGVFQWGDRVSYEWKPSPGEDRDGDGQDDDPGVDTDANGLIDDGVIWRTYSDADGDGYLLWQDANGNGVVEGGEFFAPVIADAQIVLSNVPSGGFLLEKTGPQLTMTVQAAGEIRRNKRGEGSGIGNAEVVATKYTYFLRNEQ